MPTPTSRTVRTALTIMSAVVLAATTHVASASGASAPDDETRDLTELRQATALFHDVDKALSAGWSEQPMCMEYPNGFHGEAPGAMGNHFYNVDALSDGGQLDPAKPELLLYEKRADGSWRFNAVEYVIPARDRPGTAEPPVLFGQKFIFYPEVGAAGIWGLHVWVWRHNPRGLYVNLHPQVTCEYADQQHAGH